MIGFLNDEYLQMLERKDNIPVIFIDRDGVINKRMPPHKHVLRWEDFHILPDVYEALGLCNHHIKSKMYIIRNTYGSRAK